MRNSTVKIIDAGGIKIEVSYKSVRALRLRVSPDGEVRLSVPLECTDDDIARFIAGRSGWINSRLAAVSGAAVPEGCIRLFGSILPRQVIRSLPEGFELVNGTLVLRQRFPADSSRTEELTGDFLRERLAAGATERIAHYAAMLGVVAPPFRIKHMSSRWGSWSPSSGVISLNFKLAELPYSCLDYVVAHEVCHIPEPNHGPRFHALLDRLLPENRSNPLA